MSNPNPDYVSDLEVVRDLQNILVELVRPNTLAQVAVIRAIETALPEVGMAPDDQQVVRDWLRDVAEGRL